MPRSTIANRHEAVFDKNLELRDYALPAISATTAGTPIEFRPEKNSAVRAIANYPTYSGYVANTVEWRLEVQASTTLAGTYATVGSAPLHGGKRVSEVMVSGKTVEQVVPGARFVRINAVRIGAPGNLQYGCYLADV
jgi:hypothetical protein